MHDQAGVGAALTISEPVNDFPLATGADHLLIAGGIGITPILAMARQLLAEGRRFRLIYCTRSAEETAYLPELRAELGERLNVHHDHGDPARFFDFWDEFEQARRDCFVYCCGPQPLMEEIKALSGHWPEGRVRFEDFHPVEVVRADDVAFDVTIASSGRTVRVPADRSVLEALREAGMRTVSSCESGTCGSCRSRLVSGLVDHRDMVLTPEDRERYIMICVSRAREGDLVIDL